MPFVWNNTLEMLFRVHKVLSFPRIPANNSKWVAFLKRIVEETMVNFLEGRELEIGEGKVINILCEFLISMVKWSDDSSPIEYK